MPTHLDRLKQLLGRLRELEQRAAARHDGAALRDEVTRIASALRDDSWWRDPVANAARGERHAV
jgi:hypothetical protein